MSKKDFKQEVFYPFVKKYRDALSLLEDAVNDLEEIFEWIKIQNSSESDKKEGGNE